MYIVQSFGHPKLQVALHCVLARRRNQNFWMGTDDAHVTEPTIIEAFERHA